MAKKYDIQPEWDEYTRQELYRQVAKQIFENANRRYRNIIKKGLYSPAVDAANATGGEFHSKGSTVEDLLKEIARAITFLNSDTSTVASAKKYTKAVESATPELTKNENKIVYDFYRKIRAEFPSYFYSVSSKHRHDSDRLLEEITEKVIQMRKRVYGGLGGDLFSSASLAQFKNDSLQRERALITALQEIRKNVQSQVQAFGESIENTFGGGFTFRIE